MSSNSVETTYQQGINSIDFAKLICAFLIIMVHFPPLGFGPMHQTYFSPLNYVISHCLARLAVPFFFVVSGFFLYRKGKKNLLSNTKVYVLKLLRLYVIWALIYSPIKIIDILKSDNVIINAIGFFRDFLFVGCYTQLWYFPATVIAVLIVSYLISKIMPVKSIFWIGFGLYLIGLLDDSWYGIVPQILRKPVDLYNQIFVTSRNGLFEGVVFISMGASFAEYDPHIKRPKLGLLLSLLFLLLELYVVTELGLCRDHNMYLMFIPCIYYTFHIVLHHEMKDSKHFILLRKMSTLIFLIHVLVGSIISKVCNLFSIDLNASELYLIILLSSVLISYVTIKLSEIGPFSWLKVLYS